MSIAPASNFARPTCTAFIQPQQTQNTAPIIEHRCLYTHDLRRKAKRWQDGLLRFHTFNKRVMVYDIPRNYIGDTHWREDFPVQDGDEFELDRPIMVQVGEQIGSVEQDLTGLLEKRSKKDAILDCRTEAHVSSPLAPLFASGSRMGTIISTQLRPKSLNALLSTPKSRFGRAALPLKSPHELGNEREHASMDMEPLAKRQRVETPLHLARPAASHRGVLMTSSERRVRNENARMTVRDDNPSLNEEKSSDAQSGHARTVRAKSPPLKPLSPTRPASLKNSVRLSGTCEMKSCNDRNHTRNEDVAAIEVDETNRVGSLNAMNIGWRESQSMQSRHSHVPRAVSVGRQIDSSESVGVLPDTVMSMGNSNEQAKPMVRLRMASRKRRRKLMYRDLLSQDALASENSSSDTRVGSGSSRGGLASKGRGTRMEDSLSSRYQEEQDRLEARPLPHNTRPKKPDGDSLSFSEEIPLGALSDKTRNGARSLAGPGDRIGRSMDMFQREISDSVKPIEPPLNEASLTDHDTNLALARMDEILNSRSQPLIPNKRPSIPPTGESQPTQIYVKSLLPPKQEESVPQGVPPLDDSPTTSFDGQLKPHMTPSSQFWDVRANLSAKVQPSQEAEDAAGGLLEQHSLPTSPRAPPFERPTFEISSQECSWSVAVTPSNRYSNEVTSPQEINQNLNIGKYPSATLAMTSLEPQFIANKNKTTGEMTAEPLMERLPIFGDCVRPETSSVRVNIGDTQAHKTTTGLPQFKRLRPTSTRHRSPVKKSVSNTSAASKTVMSSETNTKVGDPDRGAKEQTVFPWSKEAWDLFGCGRDGVAVRYGDFCLLEGL